MHHAEPWYANLHPYERYIEVRAGGTVAAYVPYDHRSDSMVQQQATARRIAACVNACKGIPTEDLENRQAVGGLDTYLMSDQPQCCPMCGTRTEYEARIDGRQDHLCPRCGYSFLVEDDPVFDLELKLQEVAEALRNYMRLVKYLKRTTNPDEWASHGDWEGLERAAVEALDHAGEESEV